MRKLKDISKRLRLQEAKISTDSKDRPLIGVGAGRLRSGLDVGVTFIMEYIEIPLGQEIEELEGLDSDAKLTIDIVQAEVIGEGELDEIDIFEIKSGIWTPRSGQHILWTPGNEFDILPSEGDSGYFVGIRGPIPSMEVAIVLEEVIGSVGNAR